MRRELLIVIGSLVSLAISAQTETGKILIGGSTSFSSVNATLTPGDSKNKALTLSPDIGVFIYRNLALELGVQYKKTEATGSSTSSSKSFVFIPALKIYIGKDRLKPFIYGGIGFGSTNLDYSFYEVTEKLVSYEAGAGLSFFINKVASIDFSGAFSKTNAKLEGSDTEDVIKGFGLNIGFMFYFGGERSTQAIDDGQGNQ